jgi:Undecaprenyl-phosphate glucose phosphotransferase
MDNRDRLSQSDDASKAALASAVAASSDSARITMHRQATASSRGELDTGLRYRAAVASAPRAKRAKAIARPVVCGLLRVYDWAWIFTTATTSLYLYKLINPHYRFHLVLFLLIGSVAAFSSNSLFYALRLYEFARLPDAVWQLKRILVGWASIVVVGLSLGFVTKTSANFSRIWLVTWFLMAAAGLVAGRLAVRELIARWSARDRLRRQVAIVGSGPVARRLVEECRVSWPDEIQIVGIFDDRQTRAPDEVDGVRVLGGIPALTTLVRATLIDEVMIALPCSAADRINDLTKRLRQLPVDLRLWIDVSTRKLAIQEIEYRAGAPVAALADRPLKHWSALQKRFEDIVLSVVFLPIAAPVMLLVALAIRLDSRGPAFFKQQRFGFNNDVIEVLKFRTMFVDQCDVSGAAQTRRRDSRVTRVGRFLRRTSLDELPQLFNVFAGTMSIVGPRPHPLEMKVMDRFYHDAVSDYFARHKVRPGITGLAQVNGFRGGIDTMEKAQKRLDLDLSYIERWSLGLDMKIICRTLWHLADKHAY